VITRDGNRCEYAAPHGVYPCAGDERWIAIAVFSDDEWNALLGALGSPSWAEGARYARVEGRLAHRDELDERLAEWTRGFEPYDLMERLQAARVEAGVAQDFADLARDPQLAHRGHFQQLEHVHLGALAFENYALRFSESEPTLREPGPNLGEHNQRILGGFLGMSRAEIDSLVEQGVIA
jgi:crotonobetainyl-CoA:carnitine CoA-transferase CaiB-like acyl-CoA transferase